uniref:Putative secreted protein n=1 Tax=Anopheles marajoara TaxID=58244 RepID=A0A2M4CC96_9DIPT
MALLVATTTPPTFAPAVATQPQRIACTESTSFTFTNLLSGESPEPHPTTLRGWIRCFLEQTHSNKGTTEENSFRSLF